MKLIDTLNKIVDSRILNTIETRVLGLIPSAQKKEPEEMPETGDGKPTVVEN